MNGEGSSKSLKGNNTPASPTAPLSPRFRGEKVPGKFFSIMMDGFKDDIENVTINISTIANTLRSDDEDAVTLILFEMQQVFQFCREYAENTLIPIICSKSMKWSDSLQLSAGEALIAVSVEKVRGELAKIVSRTASDIVLLTRDSSVREVWGHIMVVTLPHVTWSAKDVNKFVSNLDDGWASHRKLHARILGSLAISSRDEYLKTRIMRTAIKVCKDRDAEVRGMIAESLSSIGAAVNVSVVEKELWPCLVSLLQDEDTRIRAATMRALSHIGLSHKGKNPSAKLFNKYIPSVLLRECAKIRRFASEDQRIIDDDKYLSLEINSEVYGELLFCCYDRLKDDAAKKEVFKAFVSMATCNGPTVRKNCAFNLPGVVACLAQSGRFQLSAIVEFLSRDSDPETRWRLAAGLHETIKVLGAKNTIDNLFDTVLRLLEDGNGVVKLNTLRHLEKLISELARHSGYNSEHKLAPIFDNLQSLARGNWRTQELLARQLKLAAPLVPPPIIRSNALPLLYQMAAESSNLVRKATMAAIATCMRYIPDIIEREEVMREFREKWANGPVYWMRISFIESANAALEMYSKCLFRDTYGADVLRLSQDKVSNVRLRLAKFLPLVAPACFQMEEFHNAISRLREDEDRDVNEVMTTVYERIQTSMKEGFDNFEDDMKREEEEQELYAIHLNEQRDAQRKSGNRNRARTMFFGKVGRSTPATPRSLQSSSENDDLKDSNTTERSAQVLSSKVEHIPSAYLKQSDQVGGSKPSLRITRSFVGGKTNRTYPKRQHTMWKPRNKGVALTSATADQTLPSETKPRTLTGSCADGPQAPGSTPRKRFALKGIKSPKQGSFLKTSPRAKNE
ncbi:Armadillo-like helical domain containing protein [Gracilaria domingensis]|nr:Armadillo-like helical domain containing protein [Gracilaria domingensis]